MNGIPRDGIDRADKQLLEYESSAYGYLVNGLVAQLEERLPCKQEVEGSTSFGSTNKDRYSKPKWLKIFVLRKIEVVQIHKV